MFLYKPGYEIESFKKQGALPEKIKKKFPEEIAEQLQDEVVLISIKNNQVCKECPYCHSSVKKRDWGHRKIYDYDKYSKKVRIIDLKSQYYRCLNQDCGHSFTPETEELNGSRTKEFDEFISMRLIKDEQNIFNFSNIGLPYGLKKTVISDIVHSYIKDMNLFYFPPVSYDTLYLCPFSYQTKERFYLAALNENGDKTFLAFFGYEDTMNELKNYLSMYKDYILARQSSLILTDLNLPLIQMLKEELPSIPIAIIPDKLAARLEAFRMDHKDGAYNAVCRLIDDLKRIVKQDPLSIGEQMDIWWNSICKKETQLVRDHLLSLHNILMECEDECIRSYMYRNVDFSSFDDQIQDYNRIRTSFHVMSARIMYLDKKDYIFSGRKNDPGQYGSYDEKNNVLYRPAIPVEPIGTHSFIFNEGDNLDKLLNLSWIYPIDLPNN